VRLEGVTAGSRRARTVSFGAVWALVAVVAVEIVVTYARVPPADLYHVSGTGAAAGFGRALVFLDFPVAIAALPVALLAAGRLPRPAAVAALGAAALCGVVFWPGVVDQADLDAKLVNALPAAGVALAIALAASAGLLRERVRVSLAAAALALVLLVVAIPWIAAELGFHLDGVPLLGRLFPTGAPYEGHPAVHHGHHHGMDGVLLALAALGAAPLVRRVEQRPLRIAAGLYAGLQLTYGLANTVNDAWLEQVVKRGWVDTAVPSVLRPAVTLAWLGIVLSGLAVAAIVLRPARARAGRSFRPAYRPTPGSG
jgi:hypothetical protein